MMPSMTEKPDIVARLRAYTRHDRPVLSSDLKEAADYIEQLKTELTTAIDQRNAARCRTHGGGVGTLVDPPASVASPHRPGESQPAGGLAERLNDLDRRLAELESSVRLTNHRLDMAAGIIDRGRRERTVPDVLLSRLGEALEATRETTCPPGWWANMEADGVAYGLVGGEVKGLVPDRSTHKRPETWREARRRMWALHEGRPVDA